MGIWLVLYLFEHLLVNSLAALPPGEDARGFIYQVNAIHELPYLQVIEIVLLAFPFAIHMWWGVKYLFQAKFNSFKTDGSKPAFPEYRRNRAFTWQRLTSWVLLVGVLAHVIQMRFLEYPQEVVKGGSESFYFVRLNMDEGLYSLAGRLHVTLYNQQQIDELEKQPQANTALENVAYDPSRSTAIAEEQEMLFDRRYLSELESHPLKKNQVIAATTQIGIAILLNVRDTFKNPWMLVLYTIFVSCAVYHGFNGLWTWMIVWGVTLTPRSQTMMLRFCWCLITIVGFLGLMAVWGTYWFNLRV